ncbi:glycerophosphodiester phosphodiesterase family protein [Cyclospora cayetanensis]|nr:glycerophosphodiester phosphodiesterase family protein [Cyclospora cayetanensis]
MLHKRRGILTGGPLDGPMPVCIAHRGGQAEAPENTLSAFKYSIEECGCEMIELDVWVSKDKQLVVVHDDNLSRVCGTDTRVKDTDYGALPRVRSSKEIELGAAAEPSTPECSHAGSFFEFFPEFKCFPRQFEGEKMPLLEDVYKAFPSALINVDMKGPLDHQAIRDVVALTRRYKREKKTVFGGFMQQKLDLIKKEFPEAVMAVGPRRTFLYLLSYYLGILPFIRIHEDIFEFPVSYAYVKREALRIAAKRRERAPRCLQFLFADAVARAEAWLTFSLITNPGFVSALKRRGLLVLGWVVNKEEEYKDALDRIGCHGLMTDRPMHLRQYLDMRNKKCKK